MRTRLAIAACAATVAGLLALPSAAAEPQTTHGCLDSVPEPGSTAPVPICYSIFRPAGATARRPVPLVFHSHGWGGSRTKDATSFTGWLDRGLGVLSFDQRGFGDSGGKAHVEHPDFEGQDVKRLVDLVAALPWVVKDGPRDPRIGAIGGSYGGGYQFVGAFTELRDRGRTRFDALAPEITWFDLKESLAPKDVVRTAWVSALYAAGNASDAHTDTVHRGFAYGAATGTWPKGEAGIDLDEFFAKNGPKWHVSQGRRLDIPVLFGQGATDNLFPLEQGLQNFDKALTPRARAKSIFVGYNGGHALPTALPAGIGGAGDPCSTALGGGSFGDLSRLFMARHLRGDSVRLRGLGQYHLATAEGRCVSVRSVRADTAASLGTLVSPTGAGAPVSWKIADGPITIAGTPYLDALVTAPGVLNRVFLGLSIGTTPADARVVQHNMLPHHEPVPVTAAQRRVELPSVAVDVPAGQSLFLTVSPLSDMYVAHGSRIPGAMVLDKATVRLPVVEPKS
ncbi:MAG TPA: CocE/NonD family hydrolase [Mycobacteriales bacterium]|nr:CocE/NonD family hydrolase [Mycobacteriales bacterium]